MITRSSDGREKTPEASLFRYSHLSRTASRILRYPFSFFSQVPHHACGFLPSTRCVRVLPARSSAANSRCAGCINASAAIFLLRLEPTSPNISSTVYRCVNIKCCTHCCVFRTRIPCRTMRYDQNHLGAGHRNRVSSRKWFAKTWLTQGWMSVPIPSHLTIFRCTRRKFLISIQRPQMCDSQCLCTRLFLVPVIIPVGMGLSYVSQSQPSLQLSTLTSSPRSGLDRPLPSRHTGKSTRTLREHK